MRKKERAGQIIGRNLRQAHQHVIDAVTRTLAQTYDIDMRAICEDLCLSIDELREVASHPLATIGAHTMTHPMLATLPQAEAG